MYVPTDVEPGMTWTFREYTYTAFAMTSGAAEEGITDVFGMSLLSSSDVIPIVQYDLSDQHAELLYAWSESAGLIGFVLFDNEKAASVFFRRHQ